MKKLIILLLLSSCSSYTSLRDRCKWEGFEDFKACKESLRNRARQERFDHRY